MNAVEYSQLREAIRAGDLARYAGRSARNVEDLDRLARSEGFDPETMAETAPEASLTNSGDDSRVGSHPVPEKAPEKPKRTSGNPKRVRSRGSQ